jgi:hypothetical protein
LQGSDLKAAENPTTKRLDDGCRAFLLRHPRLGLVETRKPVGKNDWDNIMAPAVHVSA